MLSSALCPLLVPGRGRFTLKLSSKLGGAFQVDFQRIFLKHHAVIFSGRLKRNIFVTQHLEFYFRTQPAAVFAGTTGIISQGKSSHPNRVALFIKLSRLGPGDTDNGASAVESVTTIKSSITATLYFSLFFDIIRVD
jgi:hypothetical protein